MVFCALKCGQGGKETLCRPALSSVVGKKKRGGKCSRFIVSGKVGQWGVGERGVAGMVTDDKDAGGRSDWQDCGSWSFTKTG